MQRRRFLESVLTAPLGLLGSGFAAAQTSGVSPRAAGHAESLLCGVARIDITPATPVCLDGYLDAAARVSTGIHDRLYARAFAFSVGRRRLVLVSCDVASMSFADYLRRPLAATLGLAAEELLLCAVHTHSGPLLTLHPSYPDNVAYTQQLPRLLLRAGREAWRTRQPARIAFGTARSPVGASRRLMRPDGRVDMFDADGGHARPPPQSVDARSCTDDSRQS